MPEEIEQKITYQEFVELFGDSMPIEAATLIHEAPPDMTIGQIRAKLVEIANRQKYPFADEPEHVRRALQVIQEHYDLRNSELAAMLKKSN